MARYYDLVMRCPACIADGESGGTPKQWYHARCQGKLQLGDNACYKCAVCYVEAHVRNWRYICEEHVNDSESTTSAHLATAISTAGQIASLAGRQWLMRFLDALDDFERDSYQSDDLFIICPFI